MPSSGGEAADGTRETHNDEVAAEGPGIVVKQMDAAAVPQADDREAAAGGNSEGPPAPGLDHAASPGSSGGSTITNSGEVSADDLDCCT